MCTIREILKSRSDLYSLQAATEDSIKIAENDLKLKFAKDYYEVISEYGVISVAGHELTGITLSARLNVVAVTNRERLNNPKVPNYMYVIEVTNIDGIVIWQSSNGVVYQTVMDSEPTRFCNSLAEYIDL